MGADTLYGTFSGLRDDLREVLDRLEGLGVKWQGTRFQQYLRTLEEEARLKDSGLIIPVQRKEGFSSALWETVSQSRQLVHASKLWDILDAGALRSKLELVVKGQPTQTTGSDSDPARNVLLELLTAFLLFDRGFRVGITGNESDVTASIEGFPPFAVECKRPTGAQSLRKNFKALRRQLTTRYTCFGYEHGIAVIGIDRILNLASETPVRPSFSVVKQNIHDTLQETTDLLRSMAPQARFNPQTTPIAAVMLLGAVFVFEPFGVTTMEHLGIFNLAPGGDPRVAAVGGMKPSSGVRY